MAVGPDIIQTQSIPLSATSDQPVGDVPAPPLNASGHADDQAAGIAREITPEEQAVAAAARQGDPATADLQEPITEAAAENDGGEPVETPPKLEFEPIPKGVPDAAVREIQKHRRAAQKASNDAWAVARAKVGDDVWKQATEVARDALVDEAQRKAALALKDAKSAQEERDAARAEAEELRAKAAQPVVEEAQPEPRPTRDQFDDPDAFDTAVEQWADREADRRTAVKLAETAAAALKAKNEADAAQKASDDAAALAVRDAEIKTINDNWTANLEAAKAEKYPDFDEVALKPSEEGGPQISLVMSAMLMQASNGPDIAYYLGMNIEESKRIADINNPLLQAVEIGKLSQQLAQPTRSVRRASNPITPVNTTRRSEPDTVDAETEDMESYYARRTPQLRPNRQPFFPDGRVH